MSLPNRPAVTLDDLPIILASLMADVSTLSKRIDDFENPVMSRAPVLSLERASELTGVSADTLRRAIRDGHLDAGRPNGKNFMVTPEALQAWAAQRTAPRTGPRKPEEA